MKRLPARLKKPDAILMVSAHWEEPAATLLSAKNPPMLYDYYGFPDKAYSITYPAPGNPELAERVAGMLRKNSISVRMDNQRGFDHGVFIPLKLMYPEADIPIIQLSLIRGLNPAAHVALGRALRELLNENILVVGSGFSFHNQNDFQNWLIENCTGPLSQAERERRLMEWEKVPNARYCHPREEHLLPLHVCQGMANEAAEVVFDDQILGKRGVAFLWA